LEPLELSRTVCPDEIEYDRKKVRAVVGIGDEYHDIVSEFLLNNSRTVPGPYIHNLIGHIDKSAETVKDHRLSMLKSRLMRLL
jgi:hypothetical protein